MKTIFDKIINNEIPSYKIYEDDLFFVILDINPKQLGHSLIITKESKENILKNSEVILSKINLVAKKISLLLIEKLKASGIRWQLNNGSSAGQEVFHTHMHLIPYYDESTQAIVNEDILKKIIN